jgi:hypothetical protein
MWERIRNVTRVPSNPKDTKTDEKQQMGFIYKRSKNAKIDELV